MNSNRLMSASQGRESIVFSRGAKCCWVLCSLKGGNYASSLSVPLMWMSCFLSAIPMVILVNNLVDRLQWGCQVLLGALFLGDVVPASSLCVPFVWISRFFFSYSNCNEGEKLI